MPKASNLVKNSVLIFQRVIGKKRKNDKEGMERGKGGGIAKQSKFASLFSSNSLSIISVAESIVVQIAQFW